MKATKKYNLEIYLRLWNILSIKKKISILYLLPLTIVAAIFELISIGALIPFVTSMVDSKIAPTQGGIILSILGEISPDRSKQIILAGAIFSFLVVISGIIRLYLLYRINKFSFSTCAEISSEIFRKTLYQPYEVHITRNSSEIINGIFIQTNSLIYETLLPLMNLLSSIILCTLISLWLIAINGAITILIILIFCAIYGGIIFLAKASLNKYSKILSVYSTKMVKTVNEGMGGIRDILLSGCQNIFYNSYQSVNIPYRNIQSKISFIGTSPRLLAESFGMLAIVLIAISIYTSAEKNFSESIPFLAVIAFTFQKLLPLFQQIYYSLVSLKSSRGILEKTLSLMEQKNIQLNSSPINSQNQLQFNLSITIENISYSYPGEQNEVLSGISLEIKKGERIGIIGKTGCGKSTLIDLIIGLIKPSKGFIKIDGQNLSAENMPNWHSKITHVPQSIFLADATIIENIALGEKPEDIDIARVHLAAEKAQILEFINRLPMGYETVVGENGVRLSGGQRQRIGIARALYKKAEIIIFDEATSALDTETESAIMKTIYGLDSKLTFIVIAHRLTTLEGCSRVIDLHDGKITRILQSNDMQRMH